ncbi:hypothetical protein OKW26_002055 [Paraburkholderia sp. 32]
MCDVQRVKRYYEDFGRKSGETCKGHKRAASNKPYLTVTPGDADAFPA